MDTLPTSKTMPQQSRDNPDPKNILSEDQKRKRQATNRAQGEVPTYMQWSAKLAEGKYYQNGLTHKGMDTQWPVWDDAEEGFMTKTWW